MLQGGLNVVEIDTLTDLLCSYDRTSVSSAEKEARLAWWFLSLVNILPKDSHWRLLITPDLVPKKEGDEIADLSQDPDHLQIIGSVLQELRDDSEKRASLVATILKLAISSNISDVIHFLHEELSGKKSNFEILMRIFVHWFHLPIVETPMLQLIDKDAKIATLTARLLTFPDIASKCGSTVIQLLSDGRGSALLPCIRHPHDILTAVMKHLLTFPIPHGHTDKLQRATIRLFDEILRAQLERDELSIIAKEAAEFLADVTVVGDYELQIKKNKMICNALLAINVARFIVCYTKYSSGLGSFIEKTGLIRYAIRMRRYGNVSAYGFAETADLLENYQKWKY